VTFLTLEDETGFANVVVWHFEADASAGEHPEARQKGVTDRGRQTP
jgi:hypothetical protein